MAVVQFEPFVLLALSLLSPMLISADPRAQLLHTARTEAKANEALRIEGSLENHGFVFKELVVLYRGPGQEYAESKMELQYGDLWRGSIPAARMTPPGVEYYVEGRTKTGERVPLFMTARKPARVLVLSPEEPAKTEPPK
ncbi:MAG: hypothetical protein JNK82_18305 [Myxococcaceae bacterium]|nr:hypothetical protein [Myxococcaceae bacterium]